MNLSPQHLQKIIAEVLSIDVSGKHAMAKKLMKIMESDSNYALTLAIAEESNSPGLLDVWLLEIQKRISELKKECNNLTRKSYYNPLNKKLEKEKQNACNMRFSFESVAQEIQDYINRDENPDYKFIGQPGRVAKALIKKPDHKETKMKVTEQQLRGIIREAIESQYYKDLKTKISQKGEITRSVKDFSKIVIDQVETLVNGIDVPFDPIEKRFDAFVILRNEVSDYFKEIEKEYNKKIRDPKNKADAERAKLAKKNTLYIDEDSLSPESERYYMDHD